MQWHADAPAQCEKQKYSITTLVDGNLLAFAGVQAALPVPLRELAAGILPRGPRPE